MSYYTKLPFEGIFKINYPYGIKDSNYASGTHDGVDMGNASMPQVYSIINGVVSYAGWENANNTKQGFGIYVSIKYDVTSSGYKKVFFGHLDSINVKVGQVVNPTVVIGIMGNTGFSTGPHTHVEIREYNANGGLIRKLNPATYMGVPNVIGTYDSANYRINIEDNRSNKYKVIVGQGVNLRQGMGTGCDIVRALPKGTEIEVLETKEGDTWIWGKTQEGWVALREKTGAEYCSRV